MDSVGWNILAADEIIPLSDDMFATDSTICMLGLMDDSWLHVYDCSSGRLLGSHIRGGQGPGEMVNPSNAKMSADGVLLVSDPYAFNFKLFKVADYECVGALDLKGLVPAIRGVASLPNGKVFVKSMTPKEGVPHRTYTLVDPESRQVVPRYDSIGSPFPENL